MSNREKIALVYLAGVATVYILKYGVFGLAAWDSALHPHRLDADAQQYPQFAKPLLGLFS